MTQSQAEKEISHTTIVQRNEEIVQAKIDGQTVMMSIENGDYYGLEDTSNRIWELLESPKTIATLCHQLTQEFEVSDEQCFTDVVNFVKQMNEHDIVSLSC